MEFVICTAAQKESQTLIFNTSLKANKIILDTWTAIDLDPH